jgi:cobalt/nickel transport system permease protein
MHIPDGYLSPTTCTTLFATSAPFLYVALRKVKRQLHTRFLPLLAVFSAFSFVIMMFNLPLPGGTTGHATGVGVAAVVLGPWAGMLAISIALLIQALFFGDGGITTLGANCFNMAIAGCLVASFLYWLIVRHAPVASPRRVVAAAIAGYGAINAAALLTAIEFGIQPLLFHDASGAPLYAPYPLSVAIPAMMLGHLTFAGFAELIVSGGVVAYLQKTDPALLSRTASGAAASATPAPAWASTRRLWAALALLMILTPLGLLSVGSAWGEWAPQDFKSVAGRARITRASHGATPPTAVPSGLHRLSTFWTAPIPDYAPPVMRNASFGYALSAMVGGGLVILVSLATGWATSRFARDPSGNGDE